MIMQCNGADIYDFTALLINAENIKEQRKEITIDYIVNVVCSFYQIKPEILNETTLKSEIVRPRQIAHYYARLLTRKSTSEIGREVGKKDHATVLHSCRSICNLIETDSIFRKEVIKPINAAFNIY